jgi:hypothetical protein
MADCSQLLQQGLSLVQAATQHDRAGNHREALRLYSLSLDAFLSVLKKERNPHIVSTLQDKVGEYMRRAEELKTLLDGNGGRGGGGGNVGLVLPSPPADPPMRHGSSAQPQPSKPCALGDPVAVGSPPPTSASPHASPTQLQNPAIAQTGAQGGIIKIEEGELGRNFESIFAAYIAGSQEVWIRDPNLCHTHQMYNLVRFCELVVRVNRKVSTPCLRVNVSTAAENDMQLSVLQSATGELADSLRTHGVELAVTLDNQGHREAIFSSGWTLLLPHGLDIHQSPAGKFRLGECDLMLRPAKQNYIRVIKHL